MRLLNVRQSLDGRSHCLSSTAGRATLQGPEDGAVTHLLLHVRMPRLERSLRQLNCVEERLVLFVPIEKLFASSIPHLLVRIQPFQQRSENPNKPGLVNEGEQHHCLPSEALPVQVQTEIRWVEVDQGREGLRHEVPHHLRDAGLVGTDWWQDTHELLEGQERRTHLEVVSIAALQRRAANEVRGKGSVVVGIEPGPRPTALVVVDQDPAQALHVGLADPLQEVHQVFLLHLEFLKVVPLLPVRALPKPHGVSHSLTQVLPLLKPILQRLVELLVDEFP
mmetsp:Transcript_44450/g.96662  ORF Transcript_44450/g.96662 Transcript_44450/m.96662 type:complete len:279 (-) Transcript_44450:1569-2405(-)